MKLKPAEFWGLTPREILGLLDGHNWRLKRGIERDAQLACWIANYSGMRSKPIRIKDLVRFEGDEGMGDEVKTPEDAKKIIMEGVKLHKAKFWGKIKDEYLKEDE